MAEGPAVRVRRIAGSDPARSVHPRDAAASRLCGAAFVRVQLLQTSDGLGVVRYDASVLRTHRESP